MSKKHYTIILSYHFFPCHHPVLENVFAKELGRKKNIKFLFQGNLSNGQKRIWHNAKIYLVKGFKSNLWIFTIINKILSVNILRILVKQLFFKKAKYVILRDLPYKAFLLLPLRSIFKFKIYYQYSAPLGDIIIEDSKNYQLFKKIWYFVVGCNHNFFTRIVLKHSDLVFTISSSHKNELRSYIKSEKLVPLTMGVDLEWINRKTTRTMLFNEFDHKYYKIIYFGSLNFVRNPRFIIKAFAEVTKIISNCKLFLIGKTFNFDQEKELKYFCRQLNLEENIIFTGHLHRNKLQQYLRNSDISISAIPPKKCFKFSSPTKLYESLGNGVPVVANKGIYEQEKVVIESGGGILVDYKEKSFCSAIVNLLKDKKLRNEMGNKGKNYVINNYSYQKIAQNMLKFFD
jgi:glycosyltransferase involved in cell wall biosynthesis